MERITRFRSFLLLLIFGLLLGFCGSKKPRTKCLSCNHKWKPG